MERLIAMLKKNASAQVLIEAKIIEVTLNEQYSAGVNWQILGQKMSVAANFNGIPNLAALSPHWVMRLRQEALLMRAPLPPMAWCHLQRITIPMTF